MLEKIFQRSEKYDPVHPRDPGLRKVFGGLFRNTSSGESITEDTALTINAFNSGVRIISETMGMLPWRVMRREGNSKIEAVNDYRFPLLNFQPNRYQNTFEYVECMIQSLEYRGRAVAEIIYGPGGRITDLLPLEMNELTPFRAPDGTIAFEHMPKNGNRRVLLSDEVVDLRGPTKDGVNCIDPIMAHAETLGISKASERYAATFFGNGATLSGVLETDYKLGDETYQRMQEWLQRNAGIGRSHNPAILEHGMKWKPVSLNAEQSQLLQTRKFQVEEVARMLRIPAYKLQLMENVKFNTTEQQAIDFVTDTLLPRIRRFEMAHDRALFSSLERKRLYNNINASELLRGDSKARAEHSRIMWNMGAYSVDEVRGVEGLNPIEGGDRRYVPVNVMPVDKVDEVIGNGTSEPTVGERNLKPVIRSAFERIVNAENNAIERGKDMVAFYEKHLSFIERNLKPVAEVYGADVAKYASGYYVEKLKEFEQMRGQKWEDSRIDLDVEHFMKWVEDNE